MSRGHGRIQQRILETMALGEICLLKDLVYNIYKTDNPTNAQYNSVSRAVLKLQKEGYLIQTTLKWRTPIASITTEDLIEYADNKPGFWEYFRENDPKFYEEFSDTKPKFKKIVHIYGINNVKCSNKTYTTRDHHPKWSKQITRIR